MKPRVKNAVVALGLVWLVVASYFSMMDFLAAPEVAVLQYVVLVVHDFAVLMLIALMLETGEQR